MSRNASNERIWFDGNVVPADSACIPVSDRTFEHGLGLFETMRGERDRVPLWPLHRRRLLDSAHSLRLMVDESRFPDEAQLGELIRANGLEHDSSRLRLVLTGGSSPASGRIFITARPLEPAKIDGLTLADDFWPVDQRDELVRFKSLNYWARRIAHERAVAAGADDALSQDQAGAIWESARCSLFLFVNGRWIAPPADGPKLASVAAETIGRALEMPGQPGLDRQFITTQVLAQASEVILANAVRGPMSVTKWRECRYDCAGPAFSTIRQLWKQVAF